MSHISLPTLAALAAAFVLAGCSSSSEPEEKACQEQAGKACVWAGASGVTAHNGDGLDRRKTFFYQPIALSFAPDGTPWVIDWNNHIIRKVLPDDTVKTVVGVAGFPGDPIDNPATLKAPGAPGTDVQLNHSTDMLFTKDGKLLVAAWHNFKIIQIDPASGYVQILFGRGAGFAGDGGKPADIRFNQPKAIALDPKGSLYVLDQRNFRVRRISADASTIETFAGNGTKGYAGDGGPAKNCEFTLEAGGNPEPSGAIAIRQSDGAVYIADALNNRIRKIDKDGIITTVAGDGMKGYKGNGDSADHAEFANIKGMAFGPDGRLYVADTDNNRIRAIDLSGSGRVETVAGSGTAGTDNPNGKSARDIQLNRPFGIAFDAKGALYIADTFNSRIIKIPQQ